MQITRSNIEELENQLLTAIKTGNITFLDKKLHADLLFITPNGQVITKEIDLASHRAGEMVVEELTLSIEEINIINDTGVVVVVYNTKGTMLGNLIEGQFRYIRIWKEFADGLKVIGGSCTKL